MAAGDIPGASTVNKFGRDAAATTTEFPVWDGSTTYTWPTSATITHIRSAVDSAATQGLEIQVQGLDANYDLSIETYNLDGTDSTTEVALSPPLIRCFRMKVTDGTDADENIQAGPTGFATQQAIITAGYNQTLMAIYTVPAGKTAYLNNYFADMNRTGGATATCDFTLWARPFGQVFQVKNTAGTINVGSSHFQHVFDTPLVFSEKTDIYVSALASAAVDVSAGFDLILVDD